MADEMVPQREWMGYAGFSCSALVAVIMCISAGAKLRAASDMVAEFTGRFAYPEAALTPLGCVEALCLALYLVPATAFVGAVLLTGFFGGAVATHVRVGEPLALPLGVAVLIWAGLALRRDVVRRLFCGRRE